jgi:Ser/Thr protein kinase RdoA (MazF antagonist)
MAASDERPPYAGLQPDVVLDALASVGLHGDGRLLQLNSYENRVYQVYLDDGRIVVAKFYRPGRWSDAQILEEHAFAAELAAAEIPVAAPWPLAGGSTLATWTAADGASFRFGITAKLAGRAPELEDETTLEWIGRFIGRIHAVGRRVPFRERLVLEPRRFGRDARDALLASGLVPPDALDAWREVTDRALERIEAAFQRAGAAAIRLHGDCHLGNLLWTERGPAFVDLDDAVMGPPVQDLWMLLGADRASATRQLGIVLDGYEQFAEFDRRELALIEPLRTLRMIHHSAWIARRWSDPAFPVAFPWFESPAYWQQEAIRLREQLDAMAEPPLAA